MTVTEFKAFLEGMGVEGCPTPEQWKRIEAKVKELEEAPVIYPAPTVIPVPCQPPYRPMWSGSSGTGEPLPELDRVWC